MSAKLAIMSAKLLARHNFRLAPHSTPIQYVYTYSGWEHMKKPLARDIIELPCACGNLRRVARIVTRIYDQELKRVGLEISQHDLLVALDKAGEVNQKWLSTVFAMDSTTLTRTLGRLRKHGWVRSQPGSDKRERLFSLTMAGKRKLAEAQPHWERAQQTLRKALSDQGWKAMRETVSMMTKATAAS
jgi:DNA-binding MarR family transcriptional regulator